MCLSRTGGIAGFVRNLRVVQGFIGTVVFETDSDSSETRSNIGTSDRAPEFIGNSVWFDRPAETDCMVLLTNNREGIGSNVG